MKKIHSKLAGMLIAGSLFLASPYALSAEQKLKISEEGIALLKTFEGILQKHIMTAQGNKL